MGVQVMSGDAYGTASDTILIHAARSGDSRAFGALWNRHYPAALRYATRLVNRADSEDLVSEAFTSIFHALGNGAGPDEVFRPYLYTTLKNLSMRWSMRDSTVAFDEVDVDQLADESSAEDKIVSALERSYEALAFRSLPERWQEVLWYGEIEGLKPREIAVILGMNANAVAALAYRARDGFRRAWLEARAKDGLVADSPREDALLARLRVVIIPLLVGMPAAEFLRTIGSAAPAHAAASGAAAAVGATPVGGGAPTLWAATTGIASLVAAGVVVTAVSLGGLPSGDESTVRDLDRTTVAETTARGQSPQSAAVALTAPSTAQVQVIRIPGDTRNSPPVPRDGILAPVAPSPPPVVSPDAPAPAPSPAPLPQATIPIVYDPIVGQSVPAATHTVSGAGTAGSRVSVFVDGVLSGTETVESSSHWTHVITIPLEDGLHELAVLQDSESHSPSKPQTIPFVVDTVVPAEPAVSSSIDRYATAPPSLSGSAEPGATIEVTWQSLSLATVIADALGAWATGPLHGLQAHATGLEITQTDLAGHRSPATTVPLAFVPSFQAANPYVVQRYSVHVIPGIAWPGSSVRTYLDGQPVWFNGSVVQTVGGTFAAYYVVPSIPPGDYEVQIAYVDPLTGVPHSFESLDLVVLP